MVLSMKRKKTDKREPIKPEIVTLNVPIDFDLIEDDEEYESAQDAADFERKLRKEQGEL